MTHSLLSQFKYKIRNKIIYPYVRIKIKIRYWKLFRLASKVDRLSYRLGSKINWNLGQLNFFSVNLIAQNSHRLKSILLLIGHGLSADAISIFRTTIEATLDYDYITRNPEKLKLYIDYSIHLDILSLQRTMSARPLTGDELLLLEQLTNDWKEVESSFRKNTGSKKVKYRETWRDIGLGEIADNAGMENLYKLAYRDANDHIHGNSNLTKKYFSGISSAGLKIKAGPMFNPQEIDKVLPVLILLNLHTLMLVNKNFNLNLGSEMRSLEASLNRIYKKKT